MLNSSTLLLVILARAEIPMEKVDDVIHVASCSHFSRLVQILQEKVKRVASFGEWWYFYLYHVHRGIGAHVRGNRLQVQFQDHCRT